jgi:hypothetical protein
MGVLLCLSLKLGAQNIGVWGYTLSVSGQSGGGRNGPLCIESPTEDSVNVKVTYVPGLSPSTLTLSHYLDYSFPPCYTSPTRPRPDID